MSASPAVLIQAAVAQYAHYGYPVELPHMRVVPDNPAFLAQVSDAGRLLLIAATPAASMTITARVLAKPTRTARIRAYRACAARCVDAIQIALHEVAHIVQFERGTAIEATSMEGEADAIAYDLHPGFVRRYVGAVPLRCPAWRATPDYPPKLTMATRSGCAGFWRPDLVPEYRAAVVAFRRASVQATGFVWPSGPARAWRWAILGATPPPAKPIYSP